ncbi:N-acetyltransferase [Zafaria cholistanensis]|uniref:N-acetyltransferase n=1 Tax=Zafaria cholistanensis TaxID=1682741 RepID=A0A5A7NS13_9MICC|nr:GNAT family N-acetyltransferase [Zafaria cholistanensis]GER23426.1 N-acetyltransferase [Zafaria cholistanensis]
MNAIRDARPSDVPAILGLIQDLAAYEREPDAVKNTPALLHEHLFGPGARVYAHVVEDTLPGAAAPQVVGMAVWFLNYSTWEGVHGIYLEDLYVHPAARGAGHGKALLANLARIAVDRGYARVEWSVLDWNEPAIGFYDALGAASMDGWTVRRLTGEALRSVGAAAAAPAGGFA